MTPATVRDDVLFKVLVRCRSWIARAPSPHKAVIGDRTAILAAIDEATRLLVPTGDDSVKPPGDSRRSSGEDRSGVAERIASGVVPASVQGPATAREIADECSRRFHGGTICEPCLTQALDAAVRAAQRELLHDVNRVFCRGLSSSLNLDHMRDMHAGAVRDAAVRAERQAIVAADALAEAVEGANDEACMSTMLDGVEHAMMLGTKFDAVIAAARAYRALRAPEASP